MENEKFPASQNRSSSFDEADDFWELDALLPPRSAPSVRPPDVETVEVSLGEKAPISEKITDFNGKYPPITSSYASRGAKKIDFSAWQKEKEARRNGSSTRDGGNEALEYAPQNPLIFRVRILRRKTFDGIDERSLSDMRKLSEETAEFTKNVEFTALFPQYSRMTEEQKHCYIGFRTEVTRGRYPEISESYLLFLLYEIINLPDRFPPSEAVKLISALMNEYRDCSDGLFSFMCDWLADICLINQIPVPFELLEPIRERVYKRATWKEVFVPFRADVSEPDACVLLSSASAYDYRSSKYYSKETAEYFETHIPKAIGAAVRALSAADPSYLREERDVTTLSHDAFRGAFRSAKLRYNVSIDCACFTRSPLLRQTVTALVKYAENFVRELLGIRARLSVSCLATDKKELVKAYFAPFIKREDDRPPLKRGRKKKLPLPEAVPPVPEYEKYYEPQSSGFSAELAARIERDSWGTTELLINAFDNNDVSDNKNNEQAFDTVNLQKTESFATASPLYTDDSATETDAHETQESSDVERKALELILRGNSREFNLLARENGLLPDTLAENINRWAIDTYGDIALESDGSSFSVIEDYRDDLTEMLNS